MRFILFFNIFFRFYQNRCGTVGLYVLFLSCWFLRQNHNFLLWFFNLNTFFRCLIILIFYLPPYLHQLISTIRNKVYALSFWKKGWLKMFLDGSFRDLWNPYMLSCLMKLLMLRCLKYLGSMSYWNCSMSLMVNSFPLFIQAMTLECSLPWVVRYVRLWFNRLWEQSWQQSNRIDFIWAFDMKIILKSSMI